VTDHQRRNAELVEGIRMALGRGVSAERIHAELVRRNMPPEKATLLLERIQSAAEPTTQSAHATPIPEPTTVVGPPVSTFSGQQHRRSRRTPFFLALAVLLAFGGFAGVFVTSPDSAMRTDTEVERAARLTTETLAARAQLAHLDSMFQARRNDAEQIEWLRARIAKGPESFQTAGGYRAMVARYQRRREAWNRTLPDYQVITRAFRTLAEIHNAKLDSLTALKAQGALPGDAPETSVIPHVRVAAAAPPSW
jgi:hypothetical protein